MSDMMGFFFRDWNLKYVVEYERREDIRHRIAKTVGLGVKGNDKLAFACYQTIISEIMKELTDKERRGYTIQAEKWNQIGAPTLVKSQTAKSRAHKIMSTFTNRCQEKLAMEVMILYSYHTPAREVEVFMAKTETEVKLSKMFPKFITHNCKPFREYCQIAIDGKVNLIPPGMGGRNKKCPDNVQLAHNPEGCPVILAELGKGQGRLAVILWDYLNMIWGESIHMYIDETWLPSSRKITDPSKMHYKDLKEMLEKIRDTPSNKLDFRVGRNTRKVEKQMRTRGRRKKVKVKDQVVQPTESDRVDDLSETLEKFQDETDWELAQNGSGDDENSQEPTRSQGKKKRQAAVQDVIEVGMTSKAKGKMKVQEDPYNSEHMDWELCCHGSPDKDKRNAKCQGKRKEIVAMFSDIDSDVSAPANKKAQPLPVKKTPAGMSKMDKGKAKQRSTPQMALVNDSLGTDKGKQPIRFPSDEDSPSEVPSVKPEGRISCRALIESSEESKGEPAMPGATPVNRVIPHPKPCPLANSAMVRQLKEEADNATSQAQENGEAVSIPALLTPEPGLIVHEVFDESPVQTREDGEESDPDEPLKKKQHTTQVPLSSLSFNFFSLAITNASSPEQGPLKRIKGATPKKLPLLATEQQLWIHSVDKIQKLIGECKPPRILVITLSLEIELTDASPELSRVSNDDPRVDSHPRFKQICKQPIPGAERTNLGESRWWEPNFLAEDDWVLAVLASRDFNGKLLYDAPYPIDDDTPSILDAPEASTSTQSPATGPTSSTSTLKVGPPRGVKVSDGSLINPLLPTALTVPPSVPAILPQPPAVALPTCSKSIDKGKQRAEPVPEEVEVEALAGTDDKVDGSASEGSEFAEDDGERPNRGEFEDEGRDEVGEVSSGPVKAKAALGR
ncbi:hypothetical protein JAAARDRAFT_197088 [Jaapia argillacea MUCL 33604]|uniref:Uncharacterized protein n=1 Tax=Jaapia argillacea MUCL 33604 TaxID=933084 RepID=A0A067PJI6_9AGAM|nr:hypothetical protein JAAARDRAFT_197088 [Jaapia argillacea MUCL 33604]